MKITALAGGVGGAKLAHGLAQILKPDELSIIVNTGDDFEHLGLYICPDLDTVCYTLGGLANPDTGWGRANETWHTMTNIQKLGGPDWFRLGDQDLATHLERTRRIHEGHSLTQITRDFCEAWSIKHPILPMSDAPIRTLVDTAEGELAFQEYFVHRKCSPEVEGFRFDGLEHPPVHSPAKTTLDESDAVILCPSNPWVSIDPILKVLGGVQKRAVAVSPIIGGNTVKGPAAKMYAELGIEPSALAVARHYQHFLSGFILDGMDQSLEKNIQQLGIRTLVTNTLMREPMDRVHLAEDTLHFLRSL